MEEGVQTKQGKGNLPNLKKIKSISMVIYLVVPSTEVIQILLPCFSLFVVSAIVLSHLILIDPIY